MKDFWSGKSQPVFCPPPPERHSRNQLSQDQLQFPNPVGCPSFPWEAFSCLSGSCAEIVIETEHPR